MKNLKKSAIWFILLVVTFGILIVPQEVAYADTIPPHISSSFMRMYFYNQQTYFHDNSDGSCCFVALSMLLHYYDTYWDDSLVSETYEQHAVLSALGDYNVRHQSPGDNTTEYNSLWWSLRYLAIEYLHYMQPSLTGPQTWAVLVNYLYQHGIDDDWIVTSVFRDSDYMTYENGVMVSEQLFLTIQAYVDDEIPVIVFGMPKDEYGNPDTDLAHAFICYDHGEGTVLYCNPGYINTTNQYQAISAEDAFVFGYIVLEPSSPHVHSNNYIINGTACCACVFPNHILYVAPNTHVHDNFIYSFLNSTYHKKICTCGEETINNHFFVAYGALKKKCKYCGFVTFAGDTPLPAEGIEDEEN